jgi:hypothetical protein
MVIPDLVETAETADCLNQLGIVNFLNDVQDRFQKWSWQLRVIIGDEVANLYEQDLEEVGEIHVPAQPTDQPAEVATGYDMDSQAPMVEGRFVDPKFVQENRQSGNKMFDLNKLVDKSDSSPSRGDRVIGNNTAHLPNLQLDDVLSTSADSSIQATIDSVFSAHVDSGTISSTGGVDSAQYSLHVSSQTLLNEKTQTHWGSWL